MRIAIIDICPFLHCIVLSEVTSAHVQIFNKKYELKLLFLIVFYHLTHSIN